MEDYNLKMEFFYYCDKSKVELFETERRNFKRMYMHIQDLCVLFALIVMFLMFFNTYIFQAGLISILVNKFRLPITVTFIYLILCVSLHVWSLTIRWVDPEIYIWETTGYRALYVFQRSGAVLYYYFYKRTALKLGDLRFYQKSDWIKEEFENRR